jgi:hypothetical protein
MWDKLTIAVDEKETVFVWTVVVNPYISQVFNIKLAQHLD